MYRIEYVAGYPVELLPGETVIGIEAVPARPFAKLPDPLDELRRMTFSDPGAEIGGRHPALASLSPATDLSGHQHLFEVVFGRDSLIVADEARFVAPALLPTTLRYLARLQGVSRLAAPEPHLYGARREENGRIVHEVRDPGSDERARAMSEQWGWAWPLYNTDDAGLLFARMLAAYGKSHPDFLHTTVQQRDGVVRTMDKVLVRTLRWAEMRCQNVDRLFESVRPQGLGGSHPEMAAYPVWMDSPDAACREDGTLCSGPMAWIELQAYYYDALTATALLADDGLVSIDAETCRLQATRLRESVRKRFATTDSVGQPLVAYATERVHGVARPLRVLKSNPGAALDSNLFDGPQMRPLVGKIMAQTLDPDRGLICPTGIRSLASGEARFSPGRYHCGQVWPHDTHLVARGLARQGAIAMSAQLERTVRDDCETLRHYPETIRGTDDARPGENRVVVQVSCRDPQYGEYSNTIMQPGQAFQGWAVAAYADAGVRLAAIGGVTRPSTPLERRLHASYQQMMDQARTAAGFENVA